MLLLLRLSCAQHIQLPKMACLQGKLELRTFYNARESLLMHQENAHTLCLGCRGGLLYLQASGWQTSKKVHAYTMQQHALHLLQIVRRCFIAGT